MDNFGTIGGDFGFKPLGKATPMTPSRAGLDSPANSIRYQSSIGDRDRGGDMMFDEVFGGYSSASAAGGGGRSSAIHGSDKPVYDDEFFGGLKTSSGSSAKYDDMFESFSSTPARGGDESSDQFGDFVGNLGKTVPKPKKVEKDTPVFDDLLPGFGAGGSSAMRRQTSDSSRLQKPPSSLKKQTSNAMEDPFVVLESSSTHASSSGLFMDPLDEFSKFSTSGNTKASNSSGSGSVFNDRDPFDHLGKHMPRASSDGSPFGPSSSAKEQTGNFPAESFENHSPQKKAPVDIFQEPNRFHTSNASSDFHRSSGRAPSPSPPSYASATANEMDAHIGTSPRHEENLGSSGDVWLTVSEVPLFTQPTSAPPPSRPPPPRPTRVPKSSSTNARSKSNEFSSFSKSSEPCYSPKAARTKATSSVSCQMEELDSFVMGWNQNNANDDFLSGEEMKSNLESAKEVRGREHHKTARSRESISIDKIMQDAQEKEFRERRERLDHEKQQKERKEEDREQRRLEKEREQKKLEKEREKARQAVERATREARERASAEARLRAERASVEKAHNEAREREKAAVQRALSEARERAAAEAKERAEKASAEKASVRQPNNDDDLESFFSMNSNQPSSAPNSTDPLFDAETQSKGGPSVARTTSNIRKTSSSTNIDDLTSIFGAAPSSGCFQDIEGETEERRRARLERHQRTQERAAKALAEKNQRDLQVQREQAERHRIAETLDVEIKRWAAGKEGNLRALLSTLQYVLWPECGWQPVSLTDMITAASVKKIYRKATLRIHPDKVQQKGANLQQKYIAEKVFDLLQEAWKKFNSEELF